VRGGRGFPGFHRETTGIWAPNGHPKCRPSAAARCSATTYVIVDASRIYRIQSWSMSTPQSGWYR
jgi:hypothetical protein